MSKKTNKESKSHVFLKAVTIIYLILRMENIFLKTNKNRSKQV